MLKQYYKLTLLLTNKEKQTAVVILGLILLSTVLETAGVGMVVPTIALLAQENIAETYPWLNDILQFFGNPERETILVSVMGLLVLVFLFKNSVMAGITWKQMRFAFDIQSRLSKRLFKLYLNKPYAYHLKHNSSKLIYNVTSGVGAYVLNAVIPSLFIFTDTLVTIGLFGLILFVEPQGAIAALLGIGLSGYLFNAITKKHAHQWGKARKYHERQRLKHIQQGLGCVKDVVLLGREKNFLDQFNYHNLEAARTLRHNTAMQNVPKLWLEFLAVFGLALLVTVMVVFKGNINHIIPVIALFAATTFRLLPAVTRILASQQQLRFTMPLLESLVGEFEHEQATHALQNKSFAAHGLQTLQLSNIDFSYDANEATLKNISFAIGHCQSIGIIGETGSGKSTLLDIILGLLPPCKGSITLNGMPLADCKRQWQDSIGYVPQSIYLTDDSIRHNIALGLAEHEISEDLIWQAVRSAQLEQFINELPEGLDTIVGERGVRLSGGQCQRIGIARALYQQPDILVFDEATSSLDATTEKQLVAEIARFKGEKTLIVVAHRLSTVANCDLIIRLERGVIVQHGPAEEVLKNAAVNA